MSTSLEKDLHSVYIDGEMPESFVSQYESIVQADSGEKSRLEKMQKLHSLLQEDSNEKSVSDQFIEESFARLQTKMRYAKNVEFAGEPKSFVTPFIKYASSFAAAAAVFAVVFIPLHYNSLSKAKETAVAAISIMKEKSIEPIAKKDVVIDGNINKEDLPKMLAVKSEPKKAESVQKQAAPAPASESTAIAKADSPASESTETLSVEQKTIYATNLASSYGASTSFGTRQSQNAPSIGRRFRERLTAVDPFIPDFPSSSIKFSVPNFHEIGNNMEIMELPNETENETEQQ
ncbi:MAG: hypothetical protein IJJ71_09715 [Treponema sp.]|uniref:hypothetical protein n=1 Tax=Treponema sp. TaxID=166 RepID=UPI0025FE1BA8|nr:hypothetical protein [Treponema sp.]MBR0496437.1 hypothetical protein [Treponema sp.]